MEAHVSFESDKTTSLFHPALVDFYPLECFKCIDVPVHRKANEETKRRAKLRFMPSLCLRKTALARPIYLILDLDETLVSYFQGQLPPTEGFAYSPIDMRDGSDSQVAYPSELPNFVSQLAQMFKLKVSSMGSPAYVDEVIRVLDPAKTIFGPDDVVAKPAEGRLKRLGALDINPYCDDFLIIDDVFCFWENCDLMPHNFVFSQAFMHSINQFNREKLQSYFFSKTNPQIRLDVSYAHLFRASTTQPNSRLVRILQALRLIRAGIDTHRALFPSVFELRSMVHTVRSIRKNILEQRHLTVYTENHFLRESIGFVTELLGGTVSDFLGKSPILVDRSELPSLVRALASMGVEAVVDCQGLFEAFFYFEPFTIGQWELRLADFLG